MAQAKTKAQNAQRAHAAANKVRAGEAKTVKAQYLALKDSEVLADILAKVKSFSDYHTKMAQDGVGYRNTGALLSNGLPEQEVVYYTTDKRVSELDKAAGLLELKDYIERQLDIKQ